MSGPPQPKQPKQPKGRKSKSEFSPEVRAVVARRSLGLCEAQEASCWGKATMLHHILRRSQGGEGTAENALAVCARDHDLIHRNVEWSLRHGFLVRSEGRPDAANVIRGCPLACAVDHLNVMGYTYVNDDSATEIGRTST